MVMSLRFHIAGAAVACDCCIQQRKQAIFGVWRAVFNCCLGVDWTELINIQPFLTYKYCKTK